MTRSFGETAKGPDRRQQKPTVKTLKPNTLYRLTKEGVAYYSSPGHYYGHVKTLETCDGETAFAKVIDPLGNTHPDTPGGTMIFADEVLAAHPHCPHCQYLRVKLANRYRTKKKGVRQVYQCLACKKYFNRREHEHYQDPGDTPATRPDRNTALNRGAAGIV